MEDKSLCGLIKFHSARLAEVAKDTEELQASIDNEVAKAYQKGFEDGKAVNDKGCDGCRFEGIEIYLRPCSACRNAYPNQWTTKDDKIEVGEIVERYLNDKLDSTGIYLGEDGDYWNCLFRTGAKFGTFAYPSNQFKRTGNVCDITKILEAMEA